jgi:hypothetical protein
VLAMQPQLTSSSVLEISPLITGGFSCVGHIPILDKGRFRIVDLAEFPHGAPVSGEKDTYYVPQHIRILTHDAETGFRWAHPDRYYIHRRLKGVRITYDRARTTTVSESHSLYCFVDGKCQRTMPADAAGLLTPRVFDIPRLAGRITTIPGPHGQQLTLDADLGWWIGVTIGDGWVSMARNYIKGVCCSGAIKSSILPTWAAIAEQRFGKGPGKPNDRDKADQNAWGTARKLTINSKTIGEWVLPLIGHTAAGKHLPAFSMHAPEAFQRGLLAGLMDTDGHCDDTKSGRFNAAITTKSVKLADQLVWLFSIMGVDANAIERTNNAGRKAMVIYPSLLGLAALDLPLRDTKTRHGLEKLGKSPRSSQYITDVVPVTQAECDTMLQQYLGTAATAKHNKDRKAFTEYTALRKTRKQGHIGRYTAAAIFARIATKMPKTLCDRLQSSVRWSRVTRVAPDIVQDMYDLRVPGGSYTFVLSNKLSVFDSADFDGDAMQFHVPSSDEAVREAKEKLFPSQNLLSISEFEPMHAPTNEYISGLWAASTKKNPNKGVKVFRNAEDAINAYHRGEIGVDQRVEIVETGKAR